MKDEAVLKDNRFAKHTDLVGSVEGSCFSRLSEEESPPVTPINVRRSALVTVGSY